MTEQEYRQHMTDYSRKCAVLSFVQYSNPDYMMMAEAGPEIVPFLLKDLTNPFKDGDVASWDNINIHAVMILLRLKVSDPPLIPEDQRGKVRYIKNAWITWGIDHGFLPKPATPKWDFWMDNWALCWGDETTRHAHTQIGFAIVLLVVWGVYWVFKHL